MKDSTEVLDSLTEDLRACVLRWFGMELAGGTPVGSVPRRVDIVLKICFVVVSGAEERCMLRWEDVVVARELRSREEESNKGM